MKLFLLLQLHIFSAFPFRVLIPTFFVFCYLPSSYVIFYKLHLEVWGGFSLLPNSALDRYVHPLPVILSDPLNAPTFCLCRCFVFCVE